MMQKAWLSFRLYSAQDFRNLAFANRILDTIDHASSELEPVNYGLYRPLTQSYDPLRREHLLRMWTNEESARDGYIPKSGHLLMEGTRPSNVGYMIAWEIGQERFNTINVRVDISYVASAARLSDFVNLTTQLVECAQTVFARTHVEFPQTNNLYSRYDLTIRMPDLGWKTYLGKPYVELFGEERLLNTPCHSVSRLPSGHFELTLAESPFDADDPDRKRRVREYLGPDAFMEPGRTVKSYKTGLAPVFDFSQLRH